MTGAQQTNECQRDAVTLYFRKGLSDRVYSVHIDPADGLFMVRAEFGRRGVWTRTTLKTIAPVPYSDARKVFESVVKEKCWGGYTENLSSLDIDVQSAVSSHANAVGQ